jgi:hypothetical protein
MNTRVTVVFGAVVALVFVLHASPSAAQVTITYGTPYNYSNQYGSYGYPIYSVPSNQVYNTVPTYRYPAATTYRRVTPQYGVPGRYSSGYRGTYVVPHQPYSTYRVVPNYGTQIYGNGYYTPYGNGGFYYSSPSQQRGAVIGGAIGGAIGGQRSSNIGAAIGAAVGGR